MQTKNWVGVVTIGLLVLGGFAILQISSQPAAQAGSPGGWACTPGTYAVDGPIVVSVTTPAQDNDPVSINQSLPVVASASDPDLYCNGSGVWVAYGDDASSGETATDYHIWWTCSEGSFTDQYGPNGTYLAPDYVAGPDARDVDLVAHADDLNRAGDTGGADDAAVTATRKIKVWQVTVTVSQAPEYDTHDDTTVTAFSGGTALGWVIPGTPPGCTQYGANTQATGTVPAIAPLSGYLWEQQKKGVKRKKAVGDADWVNFYGPEADWQTDFLANGGYAYQDDDVRHPDGTGTNKHKIFMDDTPGFIANATNDFKIAAPDNWRDLNIDMHYQAYVIYGGVVVSNKCPWQDTFTLDTLAGPPRVWHVNGAHTP